MMRSLLPLFTSTLCLAGAPVEKPVSFFELKTHSLEGKDVDLAQYKGKVVLVVNTASECGFTPQYEGLEKLHEAMKEKGLVVLGFPSNEFGAQEPGSPEAIRKFCTLKFHVQFPLMEKVKTQGDGQSPVYAFLTAKHGAPKWNFHKYLVGKNGQVASAFPSDVEPDSPELKKALEAALAQ